MIQTCGAIALRSPPTLESHLQRGVIVESSIDASASSPAAATCRVSTAVIKSVVYRATEMGYEVLGIRRGWEGLTHLRPGDELDSDYVRPSTA